MPRIFLKITCVDPLNLRLLSKEEENESVRRKQTIGGKERKTTNGKNKGKTERKGSIKGKGNKRRKNKAGNKRKKNMIQCQD